jgi:hypothetical protein
MNNPAKCVEIYASVVDLRSSVKHMQTIYLSCSRIMFCSLIRSPTHSYNSLSHSARSLSHLLLLYCISTAFYDQFAKKETSLWLSINILFSFMVVRLLLFQFLFSTSKQLKFLRWRRKIVERAFKEIFFGFSFSNNSSLRESIIKQTKSKRHEQSNHWNLEVNIFDEFHYKCSFVINQWISEKF